MSIDPIQAFRDACEQHRQAGFRYERAEAEMNRASDALTQCRRAVDQATRNLHLHILSTTAATQPE